MAQKADLVCDICVAHGGHETADALGVRKADGGYGLHEMTGKTMNGVSSG